MTDPNRDRLQRAADLLGTLGTRFAVLGGAAVGLFLRPGMTQWARQTNDVDVIVPVDSPTEWREFEELLISADFRNDHDTIIRFHHAEDVYDFIPRGDRMANLLGFDVRFHREAFERALDVEITPGCRAPVVPLAFLFVTKVCAFQDRGQADPYESKDLEDLVALLMGSNATVELEHAPPSVQDTVAHWASALLGHPSHSDWVEGHVPGGPNHDDLVELVIDSLERLRSLRG